MALWSRWLTTWIFSLRVINCKNQGTMNSVLVLFTPHNSYISPLIFKNFYQKFYRKFFPQKVLSSKATSPIQSNNHQHQNLHQKKTIFQYLKSNNIKTTLILIIVDSQGIIKIINGLLLIKRQTKLKNWVSWKFILKKYASETCFWFFLKMLRILWSMLLIL